MPHFHSFLCFSIMSLMMASSSYAQVNPLANPLPVQPSLSGNFGELRPNHFHAGIDLKTAGREGLDVSAVDAGHVSRVKVSPYGYGKALYIDHPSGYTTVYAHLQRFAPKIEAYVKQYQVQQKSFEIDLYPGKEALPVAAGEVVAISGNTGGSAGPHLHFEVRETTTEVPRNPLLFQFPITDDKAPVIEAVAIRSLDEAGSVAGKDVLRMRVNASGVAHAEPIEVHGRIGIEMSGYDSQNGSYNHNGIYKVSLWVDGERIGQFVADSISFERSRHLNALIDYEHYYASKQRFMRLYRLPGNMLENLSFKEDGYLLLSEGTHHIEVRAEDVAGNIRKVAFNVDAQLPPMQPTSDDELFLEWDVPYLYESERAQIYFPSHMVYDRVKLDIHEAELGGRFSIQVLSPQIPVQEAFDIRLRVPEGLDREGLLIVQTNSAGRPTRALSSAVDGDWLRAQSRSFGYFSFTHDTKAPNILPLSVFGGKSYQGGTLRFKVTDDFSGIHTYRAEVDGQWVLMEYEPKQDLMTIDVKDIPTGTGVQHLTLEISDLAGNVATFEGTLKHP